ncbi:MAG: hypothetical protein IJY32_01540, partial [Mogibacterium sp.]|nr:hypothetical protein [Mogibacterium sp.]
KNLASAELFNSIENGRYGVASMQAVLVILVTVSINVLAMHLMERSRKKQKGEINRVSAVEAFEKAI